MGSEERAAMPVTTFLFTDIEDSTRLWDEQPERMRRALAMHDLVARKAVSDHHGMLVKMTGDGMHAAFDDPLQAIAAVVQLQLALADSESGHGIALRARSGLHVGVEEFRDNDFFGREVNRAARIAHAAHGGQVLLSQAVAVLVRSRLPAGLALLDLGVVRLRGIATPERMFQLRHPQLRASFPSLRALEDTPNNLPQQLTSFVGRERELAEITKLLGRTRLVTLLGAGGIGKTRLSLQMAGAVMDDYPDGAWFVEFAALNDPRLVPQTVALALGVTEEAGRPVAEALVNYARDRRLLIVLDNCEHVLGACVELAKLLLAGPNVKLLATSREPLRLTGEATYAVPALATPEMQPVVALAAVAKFESIRLFVDRAVAAQPGFSVTPENAAAVVEVCRRLDGIPLALELAAARLRSLSVEAIAARLADRFRLFVGGDPTISPRQQTLRALIDWSYELLEPKERELLQQLAVFEGGFTLEAAQALGKQGEVDELDVLDVLTLLVEKSLVTLEPGAERYRLLDTVQHYALERLDASGAVAETRTRHLQYCVAFAQDATPRLFGPEQATWLARLDLERQNLLAAHAWCNHAEDGAAQGLRLVSVMKHYWLNRGLLMLGHQVASEALARAGAQGRTAARCRGLFDAGQLCVFMGRYDEARPLLTESLAIGREIGDTARIAAALQPLGTASLGLGNYAAARTHLDEALALARELGNKRSLAAALNALGQLNRMEGALDNAESFYEQMLTLARELGEPELIAIGLLNLAMVAVARGSSDRARVLLLEVLEIVRETGSKSAGQSTLEVSAGLAVVRADYARAARLHGAADAQMRQTSLHSDPADAAFLTPLLDRARAALGAEGFASGKQAGTALAYDEAIGEARAWLAAGA